MDVRPIHPKTIHIIGDSHALAFKRKSVELSDLGMIISTSVSYIRGIQPDTLAPNGHLNPEVAKYLVGEGLIAPDGKPIALTDNPAIISEQYATGSGFRSELVIFHVGEIYVRKYLGSLFKAGQADMGVIETHLQTLIESYVKSVVGISKSFGLTAILHELSPPTGDDVQFEKINSFSCSREHRGAIYRAFNTHLNQYAAKSGAMVCRSTDYLADEAGCLNSDYEFDGVHADPKYTSISLGRIARLWLYSRSADRTLRYKTWAGNASVSTDLPKISQIGIAEPIQVFDESQVARLQKSIGRFEVQVCKRPPQDWSHAPPNSDHPKFKDVIKYGVIDVDGLQLLHDVLIKGSVGDSIRSMIGSRFSIVNVRPVESVAHEGEGIGQQSFNRDHCPPGIYRGLVYLVDVAEDDGAFEYLPVDGSPDARQVMGRAGTWVLFDANAIKHRATPPRKRTRYALDFILLAIPDEADEIVHCADLGWIWPVDPYMFSLTDWCYPEVKSRRWFSPSLIANHNNKIKTL